MIANQSGLSWSMKDSINDISCKIMQFQPNTYTTDIMIEGYDLPYLIICVMFLNLYQLPNMVNQSQYELKLHSHGNMSSN